MGSGQGSVLAQPRANTTETSWFSSRTCAVLEESTVCPAAGILALGLGLSIFTTQSVIANIVS